MKKSVEIEFPEDFEFPEYFEGETKARLGCCDCIFYVIETCESRSRCCIIKEGEKCPLYNSDKTHIIYNW